MSAPAEHTFPPVKREDIVMLLDLMSTRVAAHHAHTLRAAIAEIERLRRRIDKAEGRAS